MLHQLYYRLFSLAHVVSSRMAAEQTTTMESSTTERKAVGTVPTEFISGLCQDIMAVTDDADEIQLLAIL